MHTRRPWRRLALPLLLVCLALLLTPAGASAKELHWERYDTTIDLHPDGSFTVTEDQLISFDDGVFSEGYAVIPLGRVEEITNVRVSEDGVPYVRGSGNPGEFSANRIGGELEIRWWFEPAVEELRRFTIQYDVYGGLRVYGDQEQLWWRVIDTDFSAAIVDAAVTVNLPEPVPAGRLQADYFTEGVAVTSTALISPQQVRFEAGDIQPGHWLEVQVTFPKQTTAVAPAWQAGDDARRAEEERLEPYKALANLLLLGVGIFLVLAAPIAAVFAWYLRGRDAPVVTPIDLLREPPDDLPPGAVGTLLDERADVHDLIATLVDLAERGFLEIEEETNEVMGITLKRDWILRRLSAPGELRGSEQALLTAIFGAGGESSVKMSDIRKRFSKEQSKVKQAIYQELVEHGYFPRNPEKVRNRWRLAGLAMMGVGIFGVFNLWNRVADDVPFAIAPVIGLIISGLAVVIVSGAMPHKTPKGAEAAARWEAFKRYLEEIERYQDVGQAAGIFANYLPYAVAFKIEKGWVRKFARIDAPAPYWYRTSGSYAGGITGSVGSGGDGFGVSLQGVSTGMSVSLQSMSDGLTGMFNSASTAFTPYSKSGGGSGSGGGGGGGGGGGSRGFS